MASLVWARAGACQLVGWLDDGWCWFMCVLKRLICHLCVCVCVVSESSVPRPRFLWDRLPNGQAIQSVQCGSESTWVEGVDGSLWSCGWNEHGNCGSGDTIDQHQLVCARPSILSSSTLGETWSGSAGLWAVGAAHVLTLTGQDY